MRQPKNLSKPFAHTCDECNKLSIVLWLGRERRWLCPLCFETMEFCSRNRRKLIEEFKERNK